MTVDLRVLLVENSENDALLISHALQRAGISCRQVDTLERLAQALQQESWDCVLSDFELGAFDAFDVIAAVRDRDADIPVVVVTGAIIEEQAVAMLRSGAQNYVMKTNLIRLASVVKGEVEGTSLRRAQRHAEEALRDSEARYRAVVEDLLEFVVRWRPDGCRVFANRAAIEFFGAAFDDADWLVLTGLGNDTAGGWPGPVLGSLSPERSILTAVSRNTLADGRELRLEWTHRGIFDAEGCLNELQSVGRDVTEETKAAEAERQQHMLVEVLRDTASALNSTLDLDEVLDRILANIAWVIPHDASAIVFVEGSDARAVRLRGWEAFGFSGRQATVGLSAGERAALDSMVSRGEPLVIGDTGTHPLWTLDLENLKWVRSFAAAPLFDEGRVMGVLALFSSRPDYFSPIHVQLLEGFAHHAAAAAHNARIFEAVSQSRRELKSLAIRAVAAQEEERRRISLELHDEVGQALTAMIVNSDVIRSQLPQNADAAVVARLEDTARLAKDTLRQIRGLSLRLRPSMLDDLGLEAAVRWLTGQFSERMGILVTLRIDGLADQRMSSELETALYRVVQEGLTNAAKHAKATEMKLSLLHRPPVLELRLEDNGAGFPSTTRGAPPVFDAGLGLLGIRERIAALNGRFEITSDPGQGTTLEVTVPVG